MIKNKENTTKGHQERNKSFNRYILFTLTLFITIVFARLQANEIFISKAPTENKEKTDASHVFTSSAQSKALDFARNFTDLEKNNIEEIMTAISPLREKLRYHPLYTKMTSRNNHSISKMIKNKKQTTKVQEETNKSFNRYTVFTLTLFLAIVLARLQAKEIFKNKEPSKNKETASSHIFTSSAQSKALDFARNFTDLEREIIKEIMTAISPLREKLRYHPLYTKMTSRDNVIEFMDTHAYCVWDFMNLLKRLQSHFTSVTLPWKPSIHMEQRYFSRLVNEIVLEEETDELGGTFVSHFAFYVESIRQAQGYLSDHLQLFINDLTYSNSTYGSLVTKRYLTQPVREFLQTTMRSVTNDNILVPAASFTFGREVLLAEIFTEILSKSGRSGKDNMSKFSQYLDRHIHLDGDYHGYLATKMVIGMIKNKADLKLVIDEAVTSLNARLTLWNHLNKTLI